MLAGSRIQNNTVLILLTVDNTIVSSYMSGLLAYFAQDDDVPKDTAWVRRATSLFKNHPRLAMLGGFRGRMDVGNHFDKGTGQMWGKKYGALWSLSLVSWSGWRISLYFHTRRGVVAKGR